MIIKNILNKIIIYCLGVSLLWSSSAYEKYLMGEDKDEENTLYRTDLFTNVEVLDESEALLPESTAVFNKIVIDGFVWGHVNCLDINEDLSINLSVGSQNFTGKYLFNKSQIILYGQCGPNKITIDVLNNVVLDYSSLKNEFNKLFENMNEFRSPCVDMADKISIIHCSNKVIPKNYGLKYTFDIETLGVTYSVTDGFNEWTACYSVFSPEESNEGTATRIIRFENGITIMTYCFNNEININNRYILFSFTKENSEDYDSSDEYKFVNNNFPNVLEYDDNEAQELPRQ